MCADKNIIYKNSAFDEENNLKSNNTCSKEYHEKYCKNRNIEIDNETALISLPSTTPALSNVMPNNSVISFKSFCMLPQQTDATISVDLTSRTTADVQMSATDCEADSENSDLDSTLCSFQDCSTSTSIQKSASHNNGIINNNNNDMNREEAFFGLMKRNANNLSKISENHDLNLIYAFPNVSFGMKEVTQLQKQLDKKLLQQKLDKKIKSDCFSKLNKLTKTTTSNITDFELANKSFTQSFSATNGAGLLFDTTRFNHSNRKSKNCAIFYFKHMDTDENEEPCISSGFEHKEKEVLYHQIVSYALVVRACIRAAYAKEQERRSRCATLTTLSNVGVQNENCDCRSLIVIENCNPAATHLSYKIISTKRNNAGKPKVASAPALLLKTQTTSKKTKPSAFYIESTENVHTKTSKESLNTHTPSVSSTALIDNELHVGNSDSEDDFESLEKLQYRYYLIYLKAYEVQILFDAILREKSNYLKGSKDVPDIYITDKFQVLPEQNAVDLGSKNGTSADITTEAILDMIIKNQKKSNFNNSKEDVKLSSAVNVDTFDGTSRNVS